MIRRFTGLCVSVFCATPALAAETFGDQRFYLGDLHAHTGASVDGGSADLLDTCDGGPDNCAALSDIHETAKANNLDFWSITDHVNGGPQSSAPAWRDVVELVLEGNEPSLEYVTIPGAEVWFTIDGQPRGHKTLLLMGEDEEVEDVSLYDLDIGGRGAHVEDCAAIWDYAEELESTFGDLMLISHHPGLEGNMSTDWHCHNDERAPWYSPAVEIYSNHGNSEHHETEYDPLWLGVKESGTVDAALDPDGHALKLRFIGGTDSHDTRPGSVCTIDTQHDQHPYGGGLTIVALEDGAEFDRGAIFDAIHAGSVYTTSGPLVPLSVSWLQHGVQLGGIGSDLRLDPTEPLELHLSVPEDWLHYVISVDLITPQDADGSKSAVIYDAEEGAFVGLLEPVDFGSWVYPRVELEAEGWLGREDCDDGGDDEHEVLWLSPNYLTQLTPGEDEGSDIETESTSGPVGADAQQDERGMVSAHTHAGPDRVALPVVEAGCSSVGLTGMATLPLAVLWTRRRRELREPLRHAALVGLGQRVEDDAHS